MHPFAAVGKRMSRRSAKYPRRKHERKTMRAVRDAGPYGCATGDVAEQPAGGTEPRLYRVVQA